MRILHPRPALGRQKFIGIEFRDGAARVEDLHPEVEASLLQHGFTIEQEPPPQAKRSRRKPRKHEPADEGHDEIPSDLERTLADED